MEDPKPKSQQEISISLQNPLSEGGVGFQPIGNPNDLNNVNRAKEISFRGDTTKPFSLGIEDIDSSIMFYFENVIKPFVIQNEERIPVPVIYSSPEKWKSYQVDGYYRDERGKIMAPILSFHRTSLEKDRTIGNKLDSNNPNNYGISYSQYNSNNIYDNFNLLNNKKPIKTYYATVIPDYITVSYSCVMFTYYISQLNKLVEAIEYASDSYWGDPERFKFITKVDSFSTITELSETDERIVKCEFELKLRGHIIPEVTQKDMNSIKKFNTKQLQISFGVEKILNNI